MSWSIHQVARMSGVTARTLRHYHEIGLLSPAYIGANGYRHYEQEQLLRLQRILLLRELGMDLAAIAAVVDGERDQLEALRAHQQRLLGERDRLDVLVRTVTNTITHLERGTHMPAEEMFQGFRLSHESIADLEETAAARSGGAEQPYFDELKRRTAGWTDAQFQEVDQQGAETELKLLDLMRDGVAPNNDAVFAVLDVDVERQRALMPLNADEYAGLGRAFAAAPELRAHLDERDPALADYMSAAMVAYADARMR